jgi:hypothetical protein
MSMLEGGPEDGLWLAKRVYILEEPTMVPAGIF